MKILNSSKYNLNNQLEKYKILYVLPILFFPFSPLICFILSAYVLLFGGNVPNGFRLFLFIIGIISSAFIFGSISYIEALTADLSFYQYVYETIQTNPLSEIMFDFLQFGGGLEIGIVLLYKLYSIIFNNITPYDLAVYNSIICGIGTVIWYEKYGKKGIPIPYRAMCSAFILIFISMTTFGYLQRQALATVFILFALEMTRKRYLILFTIIATMFHLTSLPIILLWKYLLRKNLTKSFLIKSIIIIILARFLFYTFITILAQTGFQKALFYIEVMDTNSIASLRFLILITLLFVANLIFFKDNESKWKAPITILSFFYIVFLGIPLFSERVSFLFLFLYGYFLFMLFYKKLLKPLFVLFLFYSFYFTLEKTNIIKLPIDAFWSRYPIFSFEPFYYI